MFRLLILSLPSLKTHKIKEEARKVVKIPGRSFQNETGKTRK